MVAKQRMKAIFDCSADEPGELTFKEGDILVDVVKSTEEGWYEGRLENGSARGLFPFNYVKPFLEQVTDTKPTNSKPTTPKTDEIQSDSLNNFPTLDAFEAAMSQTRKGASSNNNTIQNHKIKQPVTAISPITTTVNSTPITAPVKSSLPTNSKKEEPVSLGIKLKPMGLRQDIASRSRSYSTPTSPNSNDNSNSSFEKIVRPSQLRKDQGIQSTLSTALSKGPPSSSSSISPSSGLRSSPKPENNSVPLVGLTTVKSIVTKGDTDDENDEKLVKPSQLRNRNQFNKLETRSSPSISIISSSPNATWKKNSKTAILTNKNASSDEEKKMSVPEPNNPMPRLPSRPMSAATRKSRSSRTSSTNSASTTPTNNNNNNINNKNNITGSTTTTNISSSTSSTTKVLSDSPKTTPRLSPVSQENVSQVVEKSAPPALKPKPNVVQPFLPPRPNNKLRSTSNPPPLQPKPLTPSEKPTTISTPSPSPPQSNVIKKTIPIVEVKPSNSTTINTTTTTAPPPIAAKPSSVILKQTTTAKASPLPVNGSQKPVLPSRPSLDSWRENNNNNNNSDNDENKNMKPSQLFNRARSATSPSSPSKPMDWNPSTLIKSPETKKKTPPPPPPSRQPKNLHSHVIDSAAKARYEMLFDTINDQGFVDGETILVLWKKSKLSNEDLAHLWNDCDPDHKGLLDKESFIEGMRRIDEILSKQ